MLSLFLFPPNIIIVFWIVNFLRYSDPYNRPTVLVGAFRVGFIRNIVSLYRTISTGICITDQLSVLYLNYSYRYYNLLGKFRVNYSKTNYFLNCDSNINSLMNCNSCRRYFYPVASFNKRHSYFQYLANCRYNT